MSDTRLQLVFDEASRIFINQGYARAQIRDIVKATGVSTGALYSLFSGKKAILCFIVRCVIDSEYIDSDFGFPIQEDSFSVLSDQLKQVFIDTTDKFRAILDTDIESYTFDRMLSEVFDHISKYKIILLLIENNPRENSGLWDFYVEYRKRFFDIFNRFIDAYIKLGVVRPLEDCGLSVNLMIETLAWWAMKADYQTFEIGVSTEKAKQVCLDALIHAYRMRLDSVEVLTPPLNPSRIHPVA